MKRRIAICIFLIWTLIKWSEQYILDARNNFYISRAIKKIIKTAMYTNLLFVSVYFLSVQHLQYQHILLTRVHRRNFKKRTISGTCTNNGPKNKVKHKQRAHYICTRKSIITARKMYLSLFFTFARITCILQHDWRCKMDYSPHS